MAVGGDGGHLRTSLILSLIFYLAFIGQSPLHFASAINNYIDIPGDYCGGRVDRCCTGRTDSCNTPVLGTLCYCDEFCDRNTSSDCCPDYWSVCLGHPPPELTQLGCSHEGQTIPQGQSIQINCNKCECRRSTTQPGKSELSCESNICLVQPDVISGINNNARLGWHAANYSTFWGRKLDEGLVLRLGTLEPERFVLGMYPITQKYDRSSLPKEFDGRRQWRASLQPVRDQGWCGASWAFSTLAVASDRLAIQSSGKEVISLSVQNLLACNNRGQQGCNGGHLDRAWNYMKRIGVVNDDCYPYVSGVSGSVEKCRVPRRANLQTMKCRLPKSPNSIHSSNGDHKERKELFRTPPAYRVAEKEEDIMNELRERGPVQATMKVRPDFFVYRRGVYRYSALTKDQPTAYHSVRLVGWGEDYSTGAPVKYWLVANSWGPNWGEDGYFRIVRGENESDIERFVLASWAEANIDKK